MNRVLRRTLSGGTLMFVVAGLLWWAHGSGDGKPIFIVSAAVTLAAVFEASRMGTIALRDVLPPLLVGVAGVLLLHSSAVERNLRVTPQGAAEERLLLGTAYAWCAGLAATAHGLRRALARMIPGAAAVARPIVYVALGTVLFLAYRHSDLAGWTLAAFFAASIYPTLRQPGGARGLAIAVGLAIWIVPPLPALLGIWRLWSTGGLVAFLLCAKIGDTAGYYVGTAIGRHHPFPRTSPGKTLEGCLGSFVAGTAAGGVAASTGLIPAGLAAGLAAGAIVNLAAQAGDLLESWVKRRAGVKDSSTVFGPSGGLLDQLDSLLVSVPVALLAWPFLLGPQGSD